MNTVNPIPDTYRRVTPHLAIDGAAAAIEFYKDVFGASERPRMAMPDGTVVHAEIEIGDSVVMIGEPSFPTTLEPSPKSLGGSPVALFVYVEDVDEVFRRAVKAGAKAVAEPEVHFYGDRVATLDDPFGHRWTIGTHIEDVTPEDLEQRATKLMSRF
jgi:PhnB protein